MESFRKNMIKAIDDRFSVLSSNLEFDKTYYGKVISVTGRNAKVEINGIERNAKIRNGLNINVGDVVIVKAPNGNFSFLYIDAKLGEGDGNKNGIVNVKDFGAKGDGVVDDTINFQNAISYCKSNNNMTLYVPDGIYMVKAHKDDYVGNYLKDYGGIMLESNMTLKMSDNATIKAITNDKVGYNVLFALNKENITIQGGTIQGERSSHTGIGGEWGYGIELMGCKNITIDGTRFIDCWGDGINIQVDNNLNPCEDIYISKVICDNNRRQGMSIEGVKNIIVSDSVFKNTNGTAPACGVDIEPWANTNIAEDIIIDNCIFENNENAGLLIMGSSTKNVLVSTCLFKKNGDIEGAFKTYGCSKTKISDCIFHENKTNMSIMNSWEISADNNSFDTGTIVLKGNSNHCSFTNNICKFDKDVWDGITVTSTVMNCILCGNRIICSLDNPTQNVMNISGKNINISRNFIYGGKTLQLTNSGVFDSNTVEMLSITVKFLSDIHITNNYFRMVGYKNGEGVLYTDKSSNCTISNNYYSKKIEESESKYVSLSPNCFILFAGATTDATVVDNILDMGVLYRRTSTLTFKLLKDITKIFTVNYSKRQYGNTNKAIDIFLGDANYDNQYRVSIKASAMFATSDRQGDYEFKLDVHKSGGRLYCSNYSPVYCSNSKSIHAYVISEPYTKEGKICITIKPAANEVQMGCYDVEISSLLNDVPLNLTKCYMSEYYSYDVSAEGVLFKRPFFNNIAYELTPDDVNYFIGDDVVYYNTAEGRQMWRVGGEWI